MERQVFGKEIKRRRKEKNFSQYDLAVGICSQSMLSFIESGKYVPNAQIIVKLCERLDLNTDRLILHDHYAISPIEKFSEKCEELCNNHDYIALNKFLNQETVLQSIDTVQQMQAYYYYLACSQFHIEGDKQESLRSFKLALAESQDNTISLLSLMGEAVVYSQLGKKESTINNIRAEMRNIDTVEYEKNLNILFYLQAYAYLNLNMLVNSYNAIEKGIAFITTHDSHFMLGNLFFLAAKIAEKTGEENKQRDSIQHSKLFEQLFSEKVFKDIS